MKVTTQIAPVYFERGDYNYVSDCLLSVAFVLVSHWIKLSSFYDAGLDLKLILIEWLFEN